MCPLSDIYTEPHGLRLRLAEIHQFPDRVVLEDPGRYLPLIDRSPSEHADIAIA
jgi:hypothetical protein